MSVPALISGALRLEFETTSDASEFYRAIEELFSVCPLDPAHERLVMRQSRRVVVVGAEGAVDREVIA